MSKRRRKRNPSRPAPVKSVLAAVLCAALMVIIASDLPAGKATAASESEAQTVNYIVESPSQGARP